MPWSGVPRAVSAPNPFVKCGDGKSVRVSLIKGTHRSPDRTLVISTTDGDHYTVDKEYEHQVLARLGSA